MIGMFRDERKSRSRS